MCRANYQVPAASLVISLNPLNIAKLSNQSLIYSLCKQLTWSHYHLNLHMNVLAYVEYTLSTYCLLSCWNTLTKPNMPPRPKYKHVQHATRNVQLGTDKRYQLHNNERKLLLGNNGNNDNLLLFYKTACTTCYSFNTVVLN